MSVKKKKRHSALEPKNLLTMAIAATAVILVAVVMRLVVPNEGKKDSFNEEAWRSAIIESTEEKATSTEVAVDSGLNDVYDAEAVATTSDALPEDAEENPAAEQTTETQSESDTASSGFIPPVQGAVTADYSGEELVYSKTMDDWRTHNGIDFAATEGEEVLAAADGTVEAISDSGMMGTTVVILHSGGIRTIYSNLAESTLVSVGDNVSQGTPVGRAGSTAAAEVSEPPHIHFEVSLNEEPTNPHDYLSGIESGNE